MTSAPSPPRRRAILPVAIAILAILAGGFGWLKHLEGAASQRQAHIAYLERQAAAWIENRNWREAGQAYEQIRKLDPDSPAIATGLEKILDGQTEERLQFVGYWNGQARASLDAARWGDAEAAARQVLKKFPDNTEAASLLAEIATAKHAHDRREAFAATRQLLSERHWDEAIAMAEKVVADYPNDPDATALLEESRIARDKAMADLAKAAELIAQARTRDTGAFDQQALDWLHEARTLSPDNVEVQELLEKMAAYSRTLRVPGDFATPQEALDAARDRDRILLGAQIWQGPLVVHTAVELQGEGADDTVVECSSEAGCVVFIAPSAQGARISKIGFRHASLTLGEERFSLSLVKAGKADFVDCAFTSGNGHGLAVVEGAQAVVSRCRFSANGWNGLSATGKGTSLEARDCQVVGNFEHGIEVWQEASAALSGNRCEDNSLNGIHLDAGATPVQITGNQLIANREFGIVLGSGGGGEVTGNTLRGNLIGGLAIRAAAAPVTVKDNQITANDGPGIALEKGLSSSAYSVNTFADPLGGEIVADLDFTLAPEPPAETAPERPPTPEPPPLRAIIVPEPGP